MKDELYNIFLNNNHSSRQEKILVRYNLNVVHKVMGQMKGNKSSVKLLELGVGKGYFAHACKLYNDTSNTRIEYSAFDRNREMLKQLANLDTSIKTYGGELPNLPVGNRKFDIVYCAFVVEHLNNGLEVFELISNIKKVLNEGGLIVFFTPNALSQKFEFYNIDYTHQYPTTSRNITMAFGDCNIREVNVTKINGLCTYKGFDKEAIRLLHKAVFLLYSYRLFSIVCRPFYRVPLYKLDNFFYKVFCFFKEENLMFTAVYDKDER